MSNRACLVIGAVLSIAAVAVSFQASLFWLVSFPLAVGAAVPLGLVVRRNRQGSE